MAAMPTNPTNQQLPKRTRAGGRHVKTGCLTCKVRHVKCDERRPHCLRCTSTGRACDGYQKPPSSPSHESSSSSSPGESIPMVLVRTHGTEAEQRGFHSFHTQTARALDSTADVLVVSKLIQQLSHWDGTIRNAVTAIGLLTERLALNSTLTIEDDRANERHADARMQYQKAMKKLAIQLSADRDTTTDLALLTCFLFVCFEFLQGNSAGALTHLRSGMKILASRRVKLLEGKAEATLLAQKELEATFAVLDFTANRWTGSTEFNSQAPMPRRGYMRFIDITNNFKNLNEADESLNMQLNRCGIYRRCFLMVGKEEQWEMMAEGYTYLMELDLWQRGLNTIISDISGALTQDDLHRMAVMHINHRVTKLTLTMVLNDTEGAKDHADDPTYSEIVALAETLVRPKNVLVEGKVLRILNQLKPDDPLPLFRFSPGVIQPLYFTAIHCADPGVVQKALSLLNEKPWREGAWDSHVMYNLAREKLVETYSSMII